MSSAVRRGGHAAARRGCAVLPIVLLVISGHGCASESSEVTDTGAAREASAADALPSSSDGGATADLHPDDGAQPLGDAAPAAPSSGCGPGALAAGSYSRTIVFGGLEREYDVRVPAAAAGKAVPLVLDFHGYTSSNGQQELVSGFLKEANARGFIVVHPNGYGMIRSWNAGDTCCGQARAQGLDDVGLARALVARIESQACIDTRRIYATGISNGGMLSYRLACEAADLIAAIAPVAGRIDFEPLTRCQPSRPMPVIHFHGVNDKLVPYDLGQQSIEHMRQANGCSGSAQTTYTKGQAKCETYSGCSGGAEVTSCALTAGHLAYVNADSVPIAERAWLFLSRFSLP